MNRAILGFLFGAILTAGPNPNTPPVRPKMVTDPPHAIYRTCYVGTDGNLYLAPTVEVRW